LDDLLQETEVTLMDQETVDRFEALERRLAALEGLLMSPSAPVHRPVKSISEFLREKHAISDVEKTFFVAYFIEQHEHTSPFNSADLAAAFQRAKEPLPKNLNESVNKNVRKGLLMEAPETKDSRKAWSVTSSGLSYVEESKKAK
jgi:hypothetical protein